MKSLLICLIAASLLWAPGCDRKNTKNPGEASPVDRRKSSFITQEFALTKIALTPLPLASTLPLRSSPFEVQLVLSKNKLRIAYRSPATDPKAARSLSAKLQKLLPDLGRRFRVEVWPAIARLNTLLSDATKFRSYLKSATRSGYVRPVHERLDELVKWSKEEAALLGLPGTPVVTLFIESAVPSKMIRIMLSTCGMARLAEFQFAVRSGRILRAISLALLPYGGVVRQRLEFRVSIRKASLVFEARKVTSATGLQLKPSKPIKALSNLVKGTPPKKPPTSLPTIKRIKVSQQDWGKQELLRLYRLVQRHRQKNPKIPTRLYVSPRPEITWSRLARVIAAASVLRRTAKFDTTKQLLRAAPIGNGSRTEVIFAAFE